MILKCIKQSLSTKTRYKNARKLRLPKKFEYNWSVKFVHHLPFMTRIKTSLNMEKPKFVKLTVSLGWGHTGIRYLHQEHRILQDDRGGNI